MSVAAIRRSFKVVHHLITEGETRFTDLAEILSPISRTGLSHLLSSLKEIGELEHDGRKYRLTPTAASLAGQARSIYSLPPSLAAQTQPVLARVAANLGHSSALFACVGKSTMKVMDVHNLPAPHPSCPLAEDEVPLMPFHGVAQLFLAHAKEEAALDCYRYWLPYLQPNTSVRIAASEQAFLAELAKIRRLGHAIEYRAEVHPILRVAVPVAIPNHPEIRFALGLVANFVYLLEVKSQIEMLGEAAAELSAIFDGKIPSNLFHSATPTGASPAWRTVSHRKLRSEAGRKENASWPPEDSCLAEQKQALFAS